MFRERVNCMRDIARRTPEVLALRRSGAILHAESGPSKLVPGFRREDGNTIIFCHTSESRHPDTSHTPVPSPVCRKDATIAICCHTGESRYPCDTQPASGRQTGFSIISAIFLLVVLSALAAFIVNISSGQHVSAAADVKGAQAYQAARAGIEWAAYQVLDPNSAATSATPVACPAATAFSPFTGFSVSVTCVSSTHAENGNNISVYKFSSAATSGTAGTIDYVQRQVDVTVAKCMDPSAAAPFTCE